MTNALFATMVISIHLLAVAFDNLLNLSVYHFLIYKKGKIIAPIHKVVAGV